MLLNQMHQSCVLVYLISAHIQEQNHNKILITIIDLYQDSEQIEICLSN